MKILSATKEDAEDILELQKKVFYQRAIDYYSFKPNNYRKINSLNISVLPYNNLNKWI